MQLSSRFSVAVHTLLCVALFEDTCKVTSEFVAGSAGVNPVVVRQTLSRLKRAGLVVVASGTGGARLTRGPERISLLDVYRAADLVERERLFNVHKKSNPLCPVGRNIRGLLDGSLRGAQQALENYLATRTLAGLLGELRDSEGAVAPRVR